MKHRKAGNSGKFVRFMKEDWRAQTGHPVGFDLVTIVP